MLVRALAGSAEVDDRREAARVIRDIAGVQPMMVDQDIISWFANDSDPEVRETVSKASDLAGLPGEERPRRGSDGWFGM
jgi:hypothetical protein